jgi:hypothetical protein
LQVAFKMKINLKIKFIIIIRAKIIRKKTKKFKIKNTQINMKLEMKIVQVMNILISIKTELF